MLGSLSSPEIMLILIVLLLPIIALVDIVRSEFSSNNKIVWVIVVILLSFIGAILYFIIGRGQKISKES